MWCCCAGVITCYVCFRHAPPPPTQLYTSHCAPLPCRVLPRAPSFLLHLLRRPDRSSQRVAAPSSRSCLVCSQPDCLRHSYKDRAMLHVRHTCVCMFEQVYLETESVCSQTWDGLTVPATVDIALSEVRSVLCVSDQIHNDCPCTFSLWK